jgi:hypothetical protein
MKGLEKKSGGGTREEPSGGWIAREGKRTASLIRNGQPKHFLNLYNFVATVGGVVAVGVID